MRAGRLRDHNGGLVSAVKPLGSRSPSASAVGKPGDFDHMGDRELIEFIEAQGELVRELERQLLPPPAPKQRKGATKH